ncbi:hypothetical protein LTR53_019951, partial [Teratosphaeriaceae sp. CCFEE 6253]
MGAIEGEPSTTRFSRIHRKPLHKADSGYVSDHSPPNMAHVTSHELRKPSTELPSPEQTPPVAAPELHELPGSDERIDTTDVQSLYTLEEIL